MLTFFRKNRKSVVGLLVIGFCALLMLGFGLGSFGNSGDQSVAATVGDSEISYNQYYRQYRNSEFQMRRQMGEMFDRFRPQMNLEQQAIDTLVDRTLLGRFIETAGFTAGIKQIESQIATNPWFLNSGLTKESYEQFLRASGLTPAGLESETRQQIVSTQLTSLFRDLSPTSEIELKKSFDKNMTNWEIEFVSFEHESFKDKVDVSDEKKLATWFDENSEQFRQPQAATFNLVRFSPNDFLEEVEVLEDDIELGYQEMKQEGRFKVPARFKLRQIRISNSEKTALESVVSTDSSDELSKKALEDALESLDGGADFSELAKTLSTDSTISAKNGDLGWMSYKEMAPAMADRVRELDVGEYSEATKDGNTWFVVKLEDTEDARTLPLEEVKTQVERRVKSSFAPEYAFSAAEDMQNRWRESGKTLEDFAKEQGLNLESVSEFTDASKPASLGLNGLAAKIIEYGPDGKGLFDLTNTAIVFQTTGFKDSQIPELAEVKEQVTEAYKNSEKALVAEKEANNFIASLETGKSFSEASAELGLKVENTGPVSRQKSSGALFSAPEARDKVFSLSEKEPLLKSPLAGPQAHFVARLVSKTLSSDKKFEDEETSMAELAAATSQQRGVAALLDQLKDSVEINIKPEIFERLDT